MKVTVIGGGPGGYVAAIRAAQLGGEVTLIEKENLGGTCLNVGCIPTKALLHSAELYEEAKEGAKYGIIATDVKVDFAKVQERKKTVTKQLVAGVKGLLAANKVKVVKGVASFIGRDVIEVKTEKATEIIKADKFIIATGSIPAKPPIPGIDSKQCIDSTGALELHEVPKSMVIVGGGVIGIEIATLYSALGCKIVVIEMLDEILPMMDGELTKMIRAKLAKKGVEIFTSTKVMSFKDAGGNVEVTVEMKDGSTKVFAGEKALISIGRKTNTKALGLEKAGIANDRGRITVNDKMETNVSGIYAVGDCIGKIMLAHVASAQGEVAAENACGHNSVFDSKTNPSCVYTKPEFASVGLTEEAARSQGVDYIVGKFPLAANGRAMIMGEDGMIKIIAGKKYKEVLGAHILGPRATDLIGELALAIGMEATIDEVIATIHAHPTVAEAIREAVLALEKRAIHVVDR
ncbi:dihydrolipoyl dehydrogenase [Sedimentibacter hydroxybenzoicus DSM 7310]|uniref:Dihydrolipoyl dehydrogenase n=1 Tax=Sedimentibacter hydroxybenzoicus DSM 7310 TaxID=1123245 RepID=A0A974GXC6_SEDHY|nr:dihydrolipoyl dehydrogenase [Sedimentibacter hydroxybenzoicus]NYB74935.1 dihydrolipoyl dehydrogenase [Sedimentibacter hydroxybenzoicus DSM 7310]